MPWTGLAAQLVLTICAITFVAYFKGYGSMKGESLATKEDVELICFGERMVSIDDGGEGQAAFEECEIAFADYVKATMLADVVCGDDVAGSFARIESALHTIISCTITDDFQRGDLSMSELAGEVSGIADLVRKDLGIEL